MTDLAEYVSDYMAIDFVKPPKQELAREIAEAYVDQHFSEMGISEEDVDLAVHETAERVEYYL
jgi:hypothetical protein